MASIPLHFLPAFVAVAESGSLRAAATRLNLTHSAVSRQLSELESRLGFAVFDRTSRQLVLNNAGDVLLRGAREALREINDTVRQAGQAARHSTCVLKLTMPVAFAQRWFLPRLARWDAAHPDVRIEVDASPQTRDLPRGGFHAAIRSTHQVSSGLVLRPLHDQACRSFVVASPAVAGRLQRTSPSDWSGERLLGSPHEWSRWFDMAAIAGAGVPVAPFNSLTLLLSAAEEGLGIALGRDLLVVDALRRGTLCALSVACQPADAAPYALVHAAATEDAETLAALHVWLEDEARMSFEALPA